METKVDSLTQKVQDLETKLNELFAYKNGIEELIKEKEAKKKAELELHEEINNSSVINKDEVDLFINWLERKPTRIKILKFKNRW